MTEEKAEKKIVTPKIEKAEVKIVLKNTLGENVKVEDYFYGGKPFPGFHKACGMPVEREDLLEVFNKIFNPEDGFLFYKTINKEVYIVIVPIKYSTTIGEYNNSIEGDCQKHAISFTQEGSVNLDTLKLKLKKIIPFVKLTDR